MQTQCPECKTKFSVNDGQLRAANGQVRCSRCHHVFNALEHLQAPAQPSTPGLPQQTPPETVTDFMSEADLAEFSELKAKISNDWDQDKDDESAVPPIQLEPEEEMEDDLSAVLKELERYEARSTLQEDAYAGTEPDIAATLDEMDDATPYEDDSEQEEDRSIISDPFMLDKMLHPKTPPKKKGGFLWAIGIILLLVIALGQLAWFERDQLMKYPEGRMLLETACKYAKCELPTLRAPEKIQVLSRSITVHPEIDNALLIQLTIANNANFPQPHPMLQIGLFSSDERLVMQRRFQPSEYLAADVKPGLLEPGKAMYVELAIEDPGSDVTGFKLDFF